MHQDRAVEEVEPIALRIPFNFRNVISEYGVQFRLFADRKYDTENVTTHER